MKRFSKACVNNQQPILQVIEKLFGDWSVLEIGSGSGQHAAYFAAQLPDVFWISSDLADNHASINAWLDECDGDNFARPALLDVSCQQHWDAVARLHAIDACFSANTAHIMSWQQVQSLFGGVAAVLKAAGLFVLYGPFNRAGQYTSASNANFDRQLRTASGDMGIRNDTDVFALAEQVGMALREDIAMPANNRILVFERAI